MRDTLKQRLFDLGYGTGSKTPSEAITFIEELELELYELENLYSVVKGGLEEKLAKAMAAAKVWQEDFIQESERHYVANVKLARILDMLQEIITRWDTPAWKDVEATGSVINRARKVLANYGGSK